MRRLLVLLGCMLLTVSSARAEVRVVVEPANGDQPVPQLEPTPQAPPAPHAKSDNGPSDMLWLPFFEVDGNHAAGVTTLFAVRNRWTQTVNVTFWYFQPDLASATVVVQHATLAPHGTKTVNIRDVPGIPADPVTGFRRGAVIITTDNHSSTVMGDYFRIDPTNNFASGDALVHTGGFCTHWDSRFLNGGPFTGGTTFTFFGPNTTGGTSPIMVGQVYDEAGAHRGTVQIYTADHAYEINTSQLPAAILGTFGTIEWTHQEHDPSILVATYRASGKYSVGLKVMCADLLLQ